MIVLLTGATGFLGSHLLERLLHEGYKVILAKRSTSDVWRIDHLLTHVKTYDVDISGIENIFKENQIDTVIHTATMYGRSQEKVSDILKTNLLFPLELLETATKYKVNTFINTDTFFNKRGTDYKHLGSYTLSKKQFFQWLKVFSATCHIQVLNLKLQHIYGPKDDKAKFVIWIMKELMQNKEKIALTKGEQKRDFIYIDDVVDAYMAVIRKKSELPDFEELDIGTGIQTPLKDFIQNIYDEVKRKYTVNTILNFGDITYKEGEIMAIDEDITGLLALGWKPKTSMQEGIARLVRDSVND